MKVYKLTDQSNQTKNNTQWGENITHTATGSGMKLCSDGWIHFYTNPLIAVLLNPAHAVFDCPKLWEAEASGEIVHQPLKSGCKTLTTIREIPLPEVTLTQKVVFGILCAKEVCVNPEWNTWADKWMSGEDRTILSAKKFSTHSIINSELPAVYAANAANHFYTFSEDHFHICESCAAYAAQVSDLNDYIALAKKALTYH